MAYRKCSERSIDAPKESLICYPTLSSISFPPREPANFETSCPHPMPIYTISILQRRKREPEKLPIHSIRLLLPPILPTRTIHTSLRLQKKHNQLPPPLAQNNDKEYKTYLLTDSLPTELAFYRVLDNGVVGYPCVDVRDDVEGYADSEEIEDFVDECPESLC